MYKVTYLSITGIEVAEHHYELEKLEEVKKAVEKELTYDEIEAISHNGSKFTTFIKKHIGGYKIEEIKTAKILDKPDYL